MDFAKTMIDKFKGRSFEGGLYFKYYDRTYRVTEVTEDGVRYWTPDGSVAWLAYSPSSTFQIMKVIRSGSLLAKRQSITMVIRRP